MLNTESSLDYRTPRVRGRTIAVSLCAWVLLVLVSGGLGFAAEPSATATRQDSTVTIHNFMFSPTSLVVPVGTKVSWKNLDGEPHTIKSIDDTFRSGALDQNDTFSFKFDKPGTYKYACSIHPQMVATIEVK
jgi:plastocyanin